MSMDTSSVLTDLSAEESAAEARKLINSSASEIVLVVETKEKKSMFNLFGIKKRLRKLCLKKIESAEEVLSRHSSPTNSVVDDEEDGEYKGKSKVHVHPRLTEEDIDDLLDAEDKY